MKQIIILLLSTALGVIMMSCKESGTNPPEEKPPGYQEDIPWPSLADSPWPMNHHDPQFTGRAKSDGPSSMNNLYQVDSVYLSSSISLDKSENIFILSGAADFNNGGLLGISNKGEVFMRISSNIIQLHSTPIITSDSQLIYHNDYGRKIFSNNFWGEINWVYESGNDISSSPINIGINGDIFFRDTSGALHCLSKHGGYRWSFSSPLFSGGIIASPFSPDGKILYIPGKSVALNAFDINSRSIIWSFGSNWNIATPVVDNDGNIFIYGYPHSSNGNASLVKLNSAGEQLWSVDLYHPVVSFFSSKPCLDKLGNIIVGYDTLYSFKTDGSINWKYRYKNGLILAPPVCDLHNRIYVPFELGHYSKMVMLSETGTLLFTSDAINQKLCGSPALGSRKIIVPSYHSQYLFVLGE